MGLSFVSNIINFETYQIIFSFVTDNLLKMDLGKLLSAAFAILIASCPLHGQAARLYTPEGGLPNTQMNDISQDRQGFVWISTEGGLVRFDGMDFESYRHDREDASSIISNSVNKTYEDSRGTLWVGTASGLQTLDRKSGTFSLYDFRDTRMPSSAQFTNCLVEVPGDEGFILAGTSGNGIYVISLSTYSLDDDRRRAISANLPSDFINEMYLDSRDRLWISSEAGLTVLDTRTLTPAGDVHIDESLEKFGKPLRILSFCEDKSSGDIIIATTDAGLLIYESSTATVRMSRNAEARKLNASAVIESDMFSDGGAAIYIIGTEDKGFRLFDASTERVFDAVTPQIAYNTGKWKVTCLMQDVQGNVWFGLYQTGVLVLPKSMFGFEHFNFGDPQNPAVNTACLMSIYDDEASGRLWVGTDGAGLFVKNQGRMPVNYGPDNSALSASSAMTIAKDKHGTMWIGTYQNGLFRCDADMRFTKYEASSAISTEKIKVLKYDSAADILYVGTYGAGCYAIDAASRKIVASFSDDDSRWVSALCLGGDGHLWVGTYNGPMCYDPRDKSFKRYDIFPKGSELRILAIASDARGHLWFGTGDGLFSYDAATGKVDSYTERDGLANNVVKDILCSDAGELWISTAGGLSRFSPESGKFTSYHEYDGLQGNEFRSGAAFKSASGRLYFGGNGGMTTFLPQMVDRSRHKMAQVHLTSKDEGIRKQISEGGHITIPDKLDLLSIGFLVPEYTDPRRIVYSYCLKGFDSAWKETDATARFASYTRLPHGRYRLEVKAFFEGDEDNYTQTGIDIKVLAPNFLKWWAFIIYFALASGLCAEIVYLWKQRMKHREEEKESELKELKLNQFTNLTHEIRTPLSLVMSPLQQFREAEQDQTKKDSYNLMYRNCLRINRLVNQLMDIRRVDSGQMPMHFRETDIVFFIKDVMQSFSNLAESRHISYSMTAASEELWLWIDQGNFDKVLYNILSNAFKNTPDCGRVSISVSGPLPNDGLIRKEGIRQCVSIVIFNSGSHIEEQYLPRIFERFFQADPYNAANGSGVGLNLSKMLVDLHHGEIGVRNTDDGVAFTVTIPLGKAHLTAAELSQTELHKDLYEKNSESHEDETFAGEEEKGEDKHFKAKKDIVLIDDDAELLTYFKSRLKRQYNVRTFSSGAEAWSMIPTAIPDVIVTDLVMPGMDGLELCGKIRQNQSTSHIPVIVITGEDDEQRERSASDSGADKFLSKPISIDLLRSSIAQIITSRETLKSKLSPAMDYDYSVVKMNSADEELLKRVVRSISEHLDDSEYNIGQLSRDAGISRVHLNRKLKESGNVPPSVLIKSYRLKQAAFLLIKQKVNVSEVAYRVGFSSHSYFSSAFKDYFGMTPRDFVAKYIDHPEDFHLV